MNGQRLWIIATLGCVLVAGAHSPAEGQTSAGKGQPIIDCYISTGDNHWVGSWLPIDSKASIEATIQMLKDVYGVRRIYWRGLEESTWMEVGYVREENVRYAGWWEWGRKLYKEVDPDKVAVETAHKRGIEIWGVGTLVDWGSSADTPCFGDFPHNSESKLRIEHPEWVPVDRHGVLKQGGPIEFAYPEARKALVDLHVRHMVKAGYDGMIFITYAENYSMRFQDEFGFSEPIVKEFKRRYGLDLRQQAFNRMGSRFAWYQLRGEYLTAYMRELKTELAKHNMKLGLFVNPFEPNFTQPWNVEQLMLTAGHIYVDLEGWVRDGIVDQLLVYGYCSPELQDRSLRNCLWMTRQTGTIAAPLTSSPYADRWKPFQEQGIATAIALGEDEMYLDRSNIPEQPVSALKSSEARLRMRVLAQIIKGTTKASPVPTPSHARTPGWNGASVADVAPLTKDSDLIVRRLALRALGRLKDPQAVPILEENLGDPETCIRCMAAFALGDVNRPESVGKLLAAVERNPQEHPLSEIVANTLARMKPQLRAEVAEAATKHNNPKVRSVAMRTLRMMWSKELVPVYVQGLRDSARPVRYEAAFALGNVRKSPEAVEALIEATRHEDVVVSDRAAVSLAEIVGRKEAEGPELRARFVAALKELFGRLGDGCKRADADWGYRPVGNALLAMGPEGEAVLKAYMEQTKDRRLAEFAWKTLYIRQKPNSFSEVTEKENEEAFKMRPPWLDK